MTEAFFWSQEFNKGVTVSYLHVNNFTSHPETGARERRAQGWVGGGGDQKASERVGLVLRDEHLYAPQER